ncbi:MAG: 1-acyl-sn-glycerol-3-phosphate acyltransferase [Deltaproteobacteria bacterium]|nr:1-acyl-sn-glycerol-3-phosphate acyltransferase [Deltaproteobacteria bacterium]
MDIEKFWRIIKTDFEYQSPVRTCLLVKNFPGWATFTYYLKLLQRIIIDSKAADIGEYDYKRWAIGSLDILKNIESSGGSFSISGLQGVSMHGGPFVYISNHMSMIDTFILPSITTTFTKATFVLKDELLRYPVFGKILKAINPISVTRTNPREDLKTVLNRGCDLIANGYSVIIFPQTTRSTIFDATSFNSLGVKLARRAMVPVVPVALKTDFQRNGRIVKDVGMVNPGKTLYFKFGDPIPIEEKPQVVHRKVVQFISNNLSEWGGQVVRKPS